MAVCSHSRTCSRPQCVIKLLFIVRHFTRANSLSLFPFLIPMRVIAATATNQKAKIDLQSSLPCQDKYPSPRRIQLIPFQPDQLVPLSLIPLLLIPTRQIGTAKVAFPVFKKHKPRPGTPETNDGLRTHPKTWWSFRYVRALRCENNEFQPESQY